MMMTMNNKIIRLFVSSTFNNFASERDKLAKTVFPKLDNICRKRGFRFHVIDLRWGVSNEDVAENITAQICFDEIRRCQHLSPKINFLAMSGERYGWCPLPQYITEDEYRIICASPQYDTQKAGLFGKYYQKDNNDIQHKYFLKPVSDENSDGNEYEELWSFLNYVMTADKGTQTFENMRFHASATELEMQIGYLSDMIDNTNTFVMIKENEKSVLGKDETQEKKHKAQELKERLKNYTKSLKSCEIFTYNDGEDSYVEKVEKFFVERINMQINQYEEISLYKRQNILVSEIFDDVENNYIKLHSHTGLFDMILKGKGNIFLVTGPSGCGKSYFLRYCGMKLYKNPSEEVFCVFTDIQTECRNFSTALKYIIDSMNSKGILDLGSCPKETDDKKPVLHFEECLGSIKKHFRVTVIIDSLDGLESFGQETNESLLKISVPNNVSLVLSIPSADMLNRDELSSPYIRKIEFANSDKKEAAALLEDILKKNGRCITDPEQKRHINHLISNGSSAVNIKLFSMLCRKWRSPHPKIIQYPESLLSDTLIRMTLIGENGNSYKTLRSHALGFIALSDRGLQECEIIDLLTADNDVVSEINAQSGKFWPVIIENHDPSDNGMNYVNKIPFVLWAIFYYDIKDILSESNDGGLPVYLFRHTIIKNAVIDIIGDEKENLLRIMTGYFEEKEWIIKNDKGVIPNIRRVSELFPLYRQLGKRTMITRSLKDLFCIDAFIRCGRYYSLIRFMNDVNTSGDFFISSMMCFLQKKTILFLNWNDSFLPAYCSETPLFGSVVPYMKAEGIKKIVKINGIHEMLSEGFRFPQLTPFSIFALSNAGIIAFEQNKKVMLTDTETFSLLPPVIRLDENPLFMYWNNDELILRYRFHRDIYNYEKSKLIFCRHEKNCINFDKLINPDDNLPADYYTEAEFAGNACYSNSPYMNYFDNIRKQKKKFQLYYKGIHEYRAKTKGAWTAVIVDRQLLEIIDTDTRNVYYSRNFSYISDVYWSPDGKSLIVVVRTESIFFIRFKPENIIYTMNEDTRSYAAVHSECLGKYFSDIVKTVLNFSNISKDAALGSDIEDMYQPLLGALNMNKKWFVKYYRTAFDNFVKVAFFGSSQEKLKPMRVDPVLYKDTTSNPLYISDKCNGFVINSSGKSHLFNIDEMAWSEIFETLPKQRFDNDAQKDIFDSYIVTAAEIIGFSKDDMSDKPEKENRHLRILRGYGSEEIDKMRKKYRYTELKRSKIFHGKNEWWLVDGVNGIINLYDNDGKIIFRNIINEKILACDMINNRLYILPQHSEVIPEFIIYDIEQSLT